MAKSTPEVFGFSVKPKTGLSSTKKSKRFGAIFRFFLIENRTKNTPNKTRIAPAQPRGAPLSVVRGATKVGSRKTAQKQCFDFLFW